MQTSGAPAKLVRVILGELAINAELNESPAALALWEALPLEAEINRWGQELYAAVDLAIEPSRDEREVVFDGELVFWRPGSAVCIFWGPTPASRNSEEIRAASPVVPLGRLRIIPKPDLDLVRAGELIRLERTP